MRRAILLVLVGLGLIGCGKKGPPVAPERRVPAAVADLAGVIEGSGVVLTWNQPTTRADGSRLKDLALFRIYRRQAPAESEPKPAILSRGKVVGYDELAVIRLADPAPATVAGPRVSWADRNGLTFGHRYAYTVIAVDRRGRRSPPAPLLVLRFVPAPRPPEGLTASPGDSEVRLVWSPPSSLLDGSPLPAALGYEVLQASSAVGPFSPVTTEPITLRTFTDRGLENELTYYYAIRAVRTDPGVRARSVASSTVAATPADLTPPSAPAHLVAVPSATAVRLAWEGSPEADVVGYLVYRAGVSGADFVRLTARPIATTTYVDRRVERGQTYRYVVTAVDRAARPNESARSASASASVP